MTVDCCLDTIKAYPNGGGAYIVARENVARENLSIYPGLIAAASLMIDYILTVTVSISAGVAALNSAFPPLATLLILLLAANTSYADFSRLCYFLARDCFLPRQWFYLYFYLWIVTCLILLFGMQLTTLILWFGVYQLKMLSPRYFLLDGF